MTKHTELPWSIARDSCGIYSASGECSGGYYIPGVPIGPHGFSREADAALIIRAVNNHYRLLDALERLTYACTPPRIPQDGGTIYGVRVPEREAVDAARAAIKSAKGE